MTRFLHLNDNFQKPKRGTSNFDKLYKIRPFVKYVSRRAKQIFSPRYLSIDKPMIKFKGRSGLKQYMPIKPMKRKFTNHIKPGLSVLTGKERKPSRWPTSSGKFETTEKHLPMKSTRKQCCQCSTLNRQQRSNITCTECNVGLCLECFVPDYNS